MVSRLEILKYLDSILIELKSIQKIDKNTFGNAFFMDLAYKANEKVILYCDIYNEENSWIWFHVDDGKITLEEALSICPNLAYDLDIFLDLDNITKDFFLKK